MIVAPLPLSMKIGAAPTAFHARTGELTAPGILTLARWNSSSDCLREVTANPGKCSAIENFFSIARKNLTTHGRLAREIRCDAKSCDRAWWLPEQTSAIARSAQNFVSIARDHSCVKFPFRSKRIASKIFARLSSSRNKFITFTWPHTSYLQEPISTRQVHLAASHYGFQARVYRSCSQPKFSTQQNRS